MKKIIKKTLRYLLVVLLIALIVNFIFNRIMLKKEAKYFDNPPGQMVEVDGSNMHVYVEGEGEHTFVFMSGLGTTNPVYDFRPLYEELSDNNRIVVIERFGYGYSDIVDGDRDFDTILRQDREALIKAQIDGPYVLCPHSIAGLEAELWAQKYPEEIEAIAGLDMTVGSFDSGSFFLKIQKISNNVNRFLRWAGIVRLVNTEEYYTDEEKKINTAFNCRNVMNKSMCSECEYMNKAMEEINSAPLPTVPTIQFVSNNTEIVDSWESVHRELVDASEYGQYVKLDCGHYVYKYEYEKIAESVLDFLENINE